MEILVNPNAAFAKLIPAIVEEHGMRGAQNLSLPIGRRQTDKSLSEERAKTDASLSHGTVDTERETDGVVFTNRAAADEAKVLARIDVDGEADSDAEVNDVIRHDRQTSDEALNVERRDMDAALEHEREQKRTVEKKLFEMERRKTDKDLTEERNIADVGVRRVAKVLSDERDAHVVTRAALTTRDEFLAIVSHDLRNPLGSIAMALNLVTGSPYFAAADDETRDQLNMIGRNANEALRLIGDLLDMESIAVGKLGLQVDRHDVGEIIRHTVESLKSQFSNKALSLRTPHETTVVMCDRDRISQVLYNLIGNAIKFTPPGGTITVMVQPGDVEVLISVADTGPGIPEDMRKKVFERFWQISKHDRRGLGLGLYISTMIVEAHGGRIWIDPEVRLGSTFHFTLPTTLGTVQ